MMEEDFETAFGAVLDRAKYLTEYSMQSIEDLLLPDVGRNTMPEIAQWRLHLSATSTYRSVIECLKTPISSQGALVLIRSLLEAWAHLHFIADNDEKGTSALRAIRFEAGVVFEWNGTDTKVERLGVKVAHPNEDPSAIQTMWNDYGGSGKIPIRTRKNVPVSLKKLSKNQYHPWVDALYGSSSNAVHVSATDFMLQHHEAGVNVTWAAPEYRAAWLQFATESYLFLTHAALSAKLTGDGVERMEELAGLAREISGDSIVRREIARGAITRKRILE